MSVREKNAKMEDRLTEAYFDDFFSKCIMIKDKDFQHNLCSVNSAAPQMGCEMYAKMLQSLGKKFTSLRDTSHYYPGSTYMPYLYPEEFLPKEGRFYLYYPPARDNFIEYISSAILRPEMDPPIMRSMIVSLREILTDIGSKPIYGMLSLNGVTPDSKRRTRTIMDIVDANALYFKGKCFYPCCQKVSEMDPISPVSDHYLSDKCTFGRRESLSALLYTEKAFWGSVTRSDVCLDKETDSGGLETSYVIKEIKENRSVSEGIRDISIRDLVFLKEHLLHAWDEMSKFTDVDLRRLAFKFAEEQKRCFLKATPKGFEERPIVAVKNFYLRNRQTAPKSFNDESLQADVYKYDIVDYLLNQCPGTAREIVERMEAQYRDGYNVEKLKKKKARAPSVPIMGDEDEYDHSALLSFAKLGQNWD